MFLREFLKRYENGDFDSPDISVQIEAGWADWFCKDEELAVKLKEKFYPILSSIKSDWLLDNFTVSFFNRCPVDAPLYDSIMLYGPKDGNPIHEDCGNLEISFEYLYQLGDYAMKTERNEWLEECSALTIEPIIDFLNNWEIHFVDKTFFKRKRKQLDKLKKMNEDIDKLIKQGEAILARYEAEESDKKNKNQ